MCRGRSAGTAHSISKTMIIPVWCASGFRATDYYLWLWVLNLHELTYSTLSYWMPTVYLLLMSHKGAQDKILPSGRWKEKVIYGIRDKQDAREAPRNFTKILGSKKVPGGVCLAMYHESDQDRPWYWKEKKRWETCSLSPQQMQVVVISFLHK